ncbi:MAG: radical SAM protein [Kiritimatiellae bacterium]|nr:radical SAM protein [Kiritimatiellia bacterium]
MSTHVFGPVPSRRLGRSLGVDLVPPKTCSYDCLYCQLGRTTNRTTARAEWVPLETVLSELAAKLDTKPDVITLAGSGEPTLFSRTGELLRRIKQMTKIPVVVLTNGSLFADPAVRESLLPADLVIPSLDAGDEETFLRVNRPDRRVAFDAMVGGLIAFREEYAGKYWLEVFLLRGINAAPRHVKKMARIARKIRPDRIQLNTVTRPPTDPSALAVPKAELERLAALFGEGAEVIADYRHSQTGQKSAARQEDILEMVRRRPCTSDDIAAGLGLHVNEVLKYTGALIEAGRLTTKRTEGRTYYAAGEPQPDRSG